MKAITLTTPLVPWLASPLALLSFASVATAEVPQVVADIAPVHALVAQVMGDLGAPDLVLPPGASPHGHSMRPSEARALQNADVVFWVGEGLTPWLADPLETLAEDARHVTLMEAEGITLLEFREGATFASHDHDHGGHDHDDDHAHEAADAHDHDHDHAHEAADAHDHDHDHDHAHETAATDDHDHDHAHGAEDPHVWLHPGNARAMLTAIEAALSEVDPENAATYAANAEAARAGIDALEAEVAGILAPVEGLPFVVFHDAYQYFEVAFGVEVAGSISAGDAERPSAARIAEIRETLQELGVQCIAAEPQFNPGLVATVAEGTSFQTAVMDPIGVEFTPGPELYGDMMRGLANALATCGSQS